MATAEPKRLRRTRLRNHRDIDALERRAVEHLRKAARTGGRMRRPQESIATALALGILQVRGRARALAGLTVRRELEAIRDFGFRLRQVGWDIDQADERAEDERRGIIYGRRQADRVARKRIELNLSWANALEATDGSLQRIAVTEVNQAVNAERDQLLAQQEQQVTGFVLFKVWDAMRDKNTCPVCESADGTVRPPGIPFPLGIPGAVHPYCRCYMGIMPLVVTFDYSESNAFDVAV